MARSDRLFALAHRLTGRTRRSLADLASSLGASPRTIYRDLADLEARGIPIERVDGWYRILDTAGINGFPLTARERLVITIALDNPSLARQKGFGAALRQVRAKLAAAGDTPERQTIVLTGPESSGEVAGEIVEALERAIEQGHSISMLYTSLSARKPRWRGIDPWAMVHRAGAWYVIGRCHEHDEPRTFRLDRITSVLPIGQSFARPERFDAGSWFRESWGAERGEPETCVIEFDASVAPLIRHAQYHEQESKTALPGGALEYRVQVAPTDELARWIVGFGGAARAIAPETLVDKVRAIAAGAAAAHRLKVRAAAMSRKQPRRPLTGTDSGAG